MRAPSGALPVIDIDLKNGRYWLDGAVVSLGDVAITSNPGWVITPETNLYPGLGLVSEGAADDGGSFVLPTPAQDLITAGATVKMTVGMPGPPVPTDRYGLWQIFNLAAFNAAHPYTGNVPQTGGQIGMAVGRTGLFNAPANQFVDMQQPVAPRGTIAGTYSASGIIASVDGSSTSTIALEGVFSDMTNLGIVSPGRIDAVPFGYLERVTIYRPQPDSDLPEISAG